MPSDLGPAPPLATVRSRRAFRAWSIPLAAGAAYFALIVATRHLSTPQEGLAVVWPCNAVLLCIALRSLGRRSTAILASAFAASVLANRLDQSWPTAVGVSVANLVEMGFALWMIRRIEPRRLDAGRPAHLLKFCLPAVLAPLPGALIAAWLLQSTTGAPPSRTALIWFLVSSLGYLVVTPILIVLSKPRLMRQLFERLAQRPWAILLLVAVLAGVFGQTRYPFLFLVPPALLYVCFELELAGAAFGAALTAAAAIGFSLMGRGPTTLIQGGRMEQIVILQLFLAVATLGSLPVAAVLQQRRRLLRSTERSRSRSRSAATAAIDANRFAAMAEDLAQVGYWRLDPARNVVAWSPQVYRMYGLTPGSGEIARAIPTSLHHPDDQAAVRVHVNTALQSGADFSFETRIIRPDGEERRVVMRGGCERDGAGQVTHLVGAMLDVTELARAEVALRESDVRYRLMAENAADTIIHMSLDGVVTYASPACEPIFGYTPEEMIGRATSDMTHPDDAPFLASIIPHLLESGRTRLNDRVTYRSLHKDGRWLWVEGRPTLVRDASGQATEVIDILRDVTARKDAERALETALQEAEAATFAASISERRYRLMAENATDMITRYTLDGHITFITQSCELILGYAPAELVGRHMLDYVHPDDLETTRRDFAAYVAAKPDARKGALQLRALRKDGQWVWLEGQPRVVYDEDGRPSGMQDVIRDVTARKAIEAELIAAREQAETGGRAKADFLANMSHELRTPLNSILGFAEILARSDLPAAQARYAGLIAESGRNLLAIVNDVLDLSRLDADAVRLEAEPVSLCRLMLDTIALVADQAADRGLRVRTTLPPEETTVLADASRLRQVLLNLLSNAVKFTEAGEVAVELAVETVRQASPEGAELAEVTFCVRDTGVGIAADRISHLFGRFEQADTSISRRFGGTGLGLSICKGLVERMGGTITVASAPGLGSAFTVRLTLPLAATTASLIQAVRQKPAISRVRLLVAEDLAVNQELIRLILEPHGVRIDAVFDGAAAVRAAAAEAYDLILMDMQMPGMDGLEATRRIRAEGGRSAGAPIVALTANVLPEQVERCRAAGMDDHVGKPFTGDTLLDAVARWTGPPVPAVRLAAAASEVLAEPGADRASTRDEDYDRAVLDDLRSAVGVEPVIGLLRALQHQLLTVTEGGETERDDVRRRAHAVLGAAGTLGFHRASEACRALERACMDGASLASPAMAAQTACRDAARLIDALVRDAA